MDSAKPDPPLDSMISINQMEQHALKLILSGVKKKSVEDSKLPYQPGTKKYFSFVKRVGTNELCNVLAFLQFCCSRINVFVILQQTELNGRNG